MSAERSIDPGAALTRLLEGTDTSTTGERFFQTLVRALAEALDVHGAWVTEYRREERRLRRAIAQVAATDATVLVVGETGTGKELVARAIHAASGRRGAPLVTVNCAAIPAPLIESEFFGHERGAFTGAVQRRDGRFALADRGTLFLDEIGELPRDLQPKLLRVLQEGEFEPVGSARPRRVDVRIVAATNRDLEQEVREGRFREDLFYRLNTGAAALAGLRHRDERRPRRGQRGVALAKAGPGCIKIG